MTTESSVECLACGTPPRRCGFNPRCTEAHCDCPGACRANETTRTEFPEFSCPVCGRASGHGGFHPSCLETLRQCQCENCQQQGGACYLAAVAAQSAPRPCNCGAECGATAPHEPVLWDGLVVCG